VRMVTYGKLFNFLFKGYKDNANQAFVLLCALHIICTKYVCIYKVTLLCE